MKFILNKLIFSALLLLSTATHSFEGVNHTYASLLISGSNEQAILAARSIYYENISDETLFDLVADVMWHGANGNIFITSDGLSWLAKALAKSKSKKYENALLEIDKKMAALEKDYKPTSICDKDFDSDCPEDDEQPEVFINEGQANSAMRPGTSFWGGTMVTSIIDNIHAEVNHAKVRAHIKKALDELTIISDKEFIPGKIDYTKILMSLNDVKSKAADTDNNISLREKIKQVRNRDSIIQVYQKVGYPKKTSTYYAKRTRAFIGRVSEANLQMLYGDDAILQFYYDADTPGWHVKRVLIFPAEGMIGALKSSSAPAIARSADYMTRAFISDTEVLDIAANTVWAHIDTTDNQMVNALAKTCRVIGNSHNPRYREFLNDVIKSAKSKKLANYGKKFSKLIFKGDVTQYTGYKDKQAQSNN